MSAGDAVLYRAASRPWRMSWLIVGMRINPTGEDGAAEDTRGNPTVKRPRVGVGDALDL